MSRFFFSSHVKQDLREIKTYLDALPKASANRIAKALQVTFQSIAENPYQGIAQSEFTRLAGVEVRSRLVHSYRVVYIVGGSAPEIIAVLHTARDISSIMAKRLQ